MKIKIQILIIVLLFIIITCLGLYFSLSFNNLLSKCRYNREADQYDFEMAKSNFFYLDSIKQLSLNRSICEDSVIVESFDHYQIQVNELLRYPTLIFRFSENDCNSCLLEELLDLHNYTNATSINFICLGSVQYQNNLKQLVYNYVQDSNIYFIPDDKIHLIEAENLNRPYYILTDSSLTAKAIFFPSQYISKLKWNFINFIKHSIE